MSKNRKSTSGKLRKTKKKPITNAPIDVSVFTQEAILLPRNKDSITLRIDHDVLAYFKDLGKGYQTVMNAVLKAYVLAQQRKEK